MRKSDDDLNEIRAILNQHQMALVPLKPSQEMLVAGASVGDCPIETVWRIFQSMVESTALDSEENRGLTTL